MSEIASIIADLVRAGVDPELIGRTAAALADREIAVVAPVKDEVAERKRTADRERMRQKRESRAMSRDVAQKETVPPDPPKEKNPPLISPRNELLSVLDAKRADAVIEHRRRMRKPLTQRAAHLLAAKMAKTSDPNAAADLMVERGWQGFEVEWAPSLAAEAPKATKRKTDDEMTAEELRAAWEKRLDFARPRTEWITWLWGAPPGRDGCRVPPELLTERDCRTDWFIPQPEYA